MMCLIDTNEEPLKKEKYLFVFCVHGEAWYFSFTWRFKYSFKFKKRLRCQA